MVRLSGHPVGHFELQSQSVSVKISCVTRVTRAIEGAAGLTATTVSDFQRMIGCAGTALLRSCCGPSLAQHSRSKTPFARASIFLVLFHSGLRSVGECLRGAVFMATEDINKKSDHLDRHRSQNGGRTDRLHRKMGWPTGLEPATAGITIQCST